MRENRKDGEATCRIPTGFSMPGWLRTFFYVKLMALVFAGCTKNEHLVGYQPDPAPLTVTGISGVIPKDLTDSVAVNPVVSVTFNPNTDPSFIASADLSLRKGNSTVPGTTAISGKTKMFTPTGDLSANTEYTARVTTSETNSTGGVETHEYSWKFKTGKNHRNTGPAVVSVTPQNNATDVPLNTQLAITFDQEVKQAAKAQISVTLKNGTASTVGTLSFSGNTATFTPASSLTAGTLYTASVGTGKGNGDAGDDVLARQEKFEWSFTTGGASQGGDVTAPAVSSVSPANNATNISTGTPLIITFSEPVNNTTVTSATVLLKQGTTAITGTVTASGTTATFTPSAALAAATVYTATVTTGVKDVAGNAIASNYTWSFTTAQAAPTGDVTAPTVSSVTPAGNSTNVAINSKLTVIFSEPMNAATITSSTITLKQGTTTITGTVTYSGTTATFTPSAALTGNTVYTGTVTTGVKDAAGNALASNYTWTFTTATTVALVSFASTVVPILNKCNTCHTHPWTVSTNASTFYTNLVNEGYVNTATPTSSKMYVKLNSGHPGSTVTTAEVNSILTWFTQGAKNN